MVTFVILCTFKLYKIYSEKRSTGASGLTEGPQTLRNLRAPALHPSRCFTQSSPPAALKQEFLHGASPRKTSTNNRRIPIHLLGFTRTAQESRAHQVLKLTATGFSNGPYARTPRAFPAPLQVLYAGRPPQKHMPCGLASLLSLLFMASGRWQRWSVTAPVLSSHSLEQIRRVKTHANGRHNETFSPTS